MHPDELQHHVGTLKSRMGAAFVGERTVFRGHDLHAELHDIDWVELYAFGITGRRFTTNELELLHAIWVYTSYPDARIWNNRVAALSGSMRSSGNLALSGALAVSDATIYGRGIDLRAIQFLKSTKTRFDGGTSLTECVRDELHRHRSIAGFGRPIKSGDERIIPMMSLVKKLDFLDGPFLKLAKSIEEVLLNGRWRQKMNYGGLCAALGADLGMTPQEYYLFTFPAFLAGMTPIYIESCHAPCGTILPTSCSSILYDGTTPRKWPQNRLV